MKKRGTLLQQMVVAVEIQKPANGRVAIDQVLLLSPEIVSIRAKTGHFSSAPVE